MGVFKKVNRLTPNPSIFNTTSDSSVTLPIGDNIYRALSQFSSKSAVTEYYNESLTVDDQRVMKIICKKEEPFQNSNGSWVLRSELDSRNNLLKVRELYWSVSFYVPSDIVASEEKNILKGINMQWHSGFSSSTSTVSTSPYFTFNLHDGRISVRTRSAPTGFNSNYMWFDVGPATRGVWHHFEIFQYLDYNSSNGRVTVFYNGEVAKCHNPSTGVQWTVPTTSQSGILDTWIAFPVKGNLPAVSGGVSLLDWFGKTYYDTNDLNMYFKIGFYESQNLGGLYDTNGDPTNNTDPNGDNYIEPGSYMEIWYKNVKFASKGSGETHEDVYTGLNISGTAPTLDPSLHPWFEFNSGGPYTLSISSTTGGSVSRNPTTGTIAQDGTVQLTATPDTGFEFQSWRQETATGTILSTDPVYNHIMTSDITIVGVFVAEPGEPSLQKKKLKIKFNNS